MAGRRCPVSYTHLDVYKRQVWTIVEGDGEAAQGSDECDEPCAPNWFVVDGYHMVNRVGYLVTEKPFVVTQNAPHLCIAY